MMPHLPTSPIRILFRPQPLVVPFDWFELIVIRRGRGRQGDRGEGDGIGLNGGSGRADGLGGLELPLGKLSAKRGECIFQRAQPLSSA
jgi:hypothetical protein